ncbi:hypothetical protein HMPREF0682_1967 [Propionibacterium acidifaciens F0233]|uniref:Uncharacterized protein n=1 Tax=Propionibacterium acidifaciens F0233 TaxID=553198 RepID=U2RMB4_9ACTN|nr:hypothetical protein HMPREF0682_1967 [Propionibacterium acidifaciens F0233]
MASLGSGRLRAVRRRSAVRSEPVLPAGPVPRLSCCRAVLSRVAGMLHPPEPGRRPRRRGAPRRPRARCAAVPGGPSSLAGPAGGPSGH